MKHTLTRTERNRVTLLLLIAERHVVALEALEAAVAHVIGLQLGSAEDDGTLDEVLFCAMPVEELLARLNIASELPQA